ncbi:MAG: hypothetical protein QM766_04025 [Burkholderiaceae bacterium]
MPKSNVHPLVTPGADMAESRPNPKSDESRPEVIISAALHLMSAYSRDGGCARLAHTILRHLELIAERQDVAPVVRETCAQLVDEWERLLQNAAPARKPPPRSAGARLADVITLRRRCH